MDVDTVKAGADFRKAIDQALDNSSVFLAIIGRGWLDETNPETGSRRLDEPGDFVRLELEDAIKRSMRLIPVLVDNASMPSADDLPESLRALEHFLTVWNHEGFPNRQ